jgi:copper chaperone CopZ
LKVRCRSERSTAAHPKTIKKMKKISIMKAVSALLALLLVFALAEAQTPKSTKTTIQFVVKGNCGMCKERIEAALDKPGIYKAVYTPSTQTVIVTYNPTKVQINQLHNLVAMVGHDTQLVTASNVVYANLPRCCQYRDGSCEHDDF